MPMPFFALQWAQHGDWAQALDLGNDLSQGRDYLFREVSKPRGKGFGSPGARFEARPASSSSVIAVMRWILTLPPLSMSAAEARAYSGHSLRHWLPTLVRLLAFSIEDRNEVARWAATADTRGRRGSMPNLYATEAEAPRIMDIQRRAFERLDAAVHAAVQHGASVSNPFPGGWQEFASALHSAEQECDMQAVCAMQSGMDTATIEAEPSSSESEDED